MDTMGVIVILLGLGLLILMALRNFPIIISAVIAGSFVLLFTGSNVYEGLTATFMGGFAGFVTNFLLIFLLGAIFGKVVQISGATESIASFIINKFGTKYVIVGIIVTAGLLSFGGLSVYVCLFALYPIAMSLFKKADLPRRLFVGAYVAGVSTFAQISPFSPSTQNILPTKYLDTDIGALPIPGILTAILLFVLVNLWMHRQGVQAKKNNEHFVPIPQDVDIDPDAKRPSFIIALIPMVLLVVLLNVFKWKIEVSLAAGILAGAICYFPFLPKKSDVIFSHMQTAITDAVSSIANTSSTVGFGAVISSTAAFNSLIPVVTNLPISPTITVGLGTTILCGIAGGATGGLGIAIPIMANIFLPQGMDPALLHRTAVVWCSGLDTLPHNGGIISFLNYSHTTHKEGYFNVFMVSVAITLITCVFYMFLLWIMGYM